MKKSIFFLGCFMLLGIYGFSQSITPFASLYKSTQKGGIVYLSNVALGCSADPPAGCAAGTNENPPAGTWINNGYTAAYVDVDGDASTFMSSSDSLNLPNCTRITKAILFWGASGSTTPGFVNIKVKVNNGVYQNISAAASQTNNIGFDGYHCYADITQVFQNSNAKCRITVADIPSDQVGSTDKFGAWCIAVAYQSETSPMRQLSIFSGLANVDNSSAATQSVTIPVSGFFTPVAGAVNFELGVFAFDGDRSQAGDNILFNNILVSDAANLAGDVMNSSATHNGTVTAFRKPSMNNMTGADADIYFPNNVLKNYLGNSATSTNIQLVTAGENFLPQCVTTAIDVQEPDLRTTLQVTDINGGNIMPGDMLRYRIKAWNLGNDNSTNTFITDTLDINTNYVPGSLNVTFGPNSGLKTDATGDDQGEYIAATRLIKVRVGTGANGVSGGTMNGSITGLDSTLVTFSVTVTNSCVKMVCNSLINARSYVFGTCATSTNTFVMASTPGGIGGDGCPNQGVTMSAITATACLTPTATNTSPVCVGSNFSLAASSDSEASYLWNGPNSYTSAVQNPTITSAQLTHSGLYVITLYIPGTSCMLSTSTSVTVSAVPVLTVSASPTVLCSGNTSILIAEGATSYTWNPGSLPSGTVIANPSVTTQYTVTGENPGCPTVTAAVTVSVNPSPFVSAGPHQTLCTTATSATMAANTPTAGSGVWTKIFGAAGDAITNPTLATTSITGLTPGVYVYNWEITNGPCTISDQVSITIDPAGCDGDTDGIANYLDLDNDNDGITDTAEGTGDADGDGLQDWLDLDSDNDGILDLYESSLSATQTATLDTNGDGRVDGSVGANGIPNAAETSNDSGTSIVLLIDSDSDGRQNHIDLDSDNDGIFDNAEANLLAIDTNTDGVVNGSDTDGDGIINVAPIDTNTGLGGTNASNIDTDGDGLQNNRDLDSDNDGITDLFEAGYAAIDTDTDGIVNGTDLDGDGIINVAAIDNNATYGGNGVAVINTDGDGVANYIDLDSDNDGIFDVSEAGFGASDSDNDGLLNGTDSDNDGIVNAGGVDTNTGFGGTGPATLPDKDSDTRANIFDLDSDNDGILDAAENGLGAVDVNNDGILDGTDTDADGIINAAGADANSVFGGTGSGLQDNDVDTHPNYADLDSDNDGILDLHEGGYSDAQLAVLDSDNNGVVNGTDSDGDGIVNLPGLDANIIFGGTSITMANTDGDGSLNYLDLDSDNDGISDVAESRIIGIILDFDSDGILTGTDTDGDGIINVTGADGNSTYGGTAATLSETDGDLVKNYLDLDSDNDGISDAAENGNGASDTNNDGIIDGTDSDSDGIINVAAIDNNSSYGGNSLVYLDPDIDFAPNAIDLDSDNDGISDIDEDGNSLLDPGNDGVVDGTDTDGDGILNNSIIDNNGTFGGQNLQNTDTDGDGVANAYDLDSDNDGICDVVEDGKGQLDFIKNGVIDGIDTDGDGILNNSTLDNNSVFGGQNLVAANADTDAIPNFRDIDSDNDGITDIKESGNAALDSNNDGMADGADTDGDGIVNAAGLDNNTIFGGVSPEPLNTDATLGANYLDIDSENDGIVDNIEGQSTTAYIAPAGSDTDGDGLDNAYDNIVGNGGAGILPVNTDGADDPDYIDANADNDGLNDNIEGWDTDGNGVANVIFINSDLDGDGLDDPYDSNDGLWNPTNGATPSSYPNVATPNTPERDWRDDDDFDNDGVNDVVDLDDDNDGIRDNADGTNDTDGDGLTDNKDLDSDNDGIPDIKEVGGPDSEGDGIYGTGIPTVGSNGWPDAVDNTVGGSILTVPNSDNDVFEDIDDLDSDNDGIPDVIEAKGIDGDANATIGSAWVDTDNDGLHESVDPTGSFPGTPLAVPDTDADGKADIKDLDSDADGSMDITEQGGTDSNGNGMVDGTFTDGDGDGWSNVFDADNGGTALDYLLDCNDNALVNYLDPAPCEITVPQGFSPNGDGVNDLLVIRGIGSFPESKLTVFNRWGATVYEKTAYDNTWDGKSNKGITIGGNDLPEGTYFYILELGGTKDPVKGFVYLNRNIK